MKEWFINKKRLANYVPSAAEVKVCSILDGIGLEYDQEISFNACRSHNNGLLVFDFIIPSKKILIEYDGPHHETSIYTIENDQIKNKFAKDFGYHLFRFNKSNWHTLKRDITAKVSGCRKADLKLANQWGDYGQKKKVKTSKKERMERVSKKIGITIDVYNMLYPHRQG